MLINLEKEKLNPDLILSEFKQGKSFTKCLMIGDKKSYEIELIKSKMKGFELVFNINESEDKSLEKALKLVELFLNEIGKEK